MNHRVSMLSFVIHHQKMGGCWTLNGVLFLTAKQPKCFRDGCNLQKVKISNLQLQLFFPQKVSMLQRSDPNFVPRVRVVMCPALPWISCYAEATFDCQRIGPHSCGDHQETGGGMTTTWGMKVDSDHNPPMKKGKVEEIVVERLEMIGWQWMITTYDRNISGCFAQMYIVW